MHEVIASAMVIPKQMPGDPHAHLIIGGAGMVGRDFAERLVKDGRLGGREISALSLYDVVPPVAPAGAVLRSGS